MKRKIYFLFVLILLATAVVNAQNTFIKGDKVVNVGIGFGSNLYTGGHFMNRFPPLSGSFEIGVKDELFDEKSSLGVGGYLGYTSAKYDEGSFGWKYSSFVIGPRAALHYQLIDKLDTYGGVMLGYDIATSKSYGSTYWSSSGYSAGGFAWSLYLGGRYYFSDNLAGMIELGYGIAYLNLGIAIKL
jgi:hypothetical protein